VEKSSTLFLDIITLVPYANKMGSDKLFIAGDRPFIYIYIYILWKAKALKFTPGELHVSLLPIFRKISQMTLFHFFVFYLAGRI
jgi:hypothetical protein